MPPPQSSHLFTVDWVIGLKIKIITAFRDEICGRVYAFDAASNTITLFSAVELNTGSSPAVNTMLHACTVHTWKISHLESVQVLEKPVQKSAEETAAPFTTAVPAIGPISLPSLEVKGNPKAKNARASISQIPNGVSNDGRAIFMALSKTLPCKWNGKSIAVLDDIIVDPPYTANATKSLRNDVNGLGRVRTVLEGERRRMEESRKANEKKGG
ncbi:Protein LSM12 A [Neolecta irregularis DAH-3]|uniref:Protein LSM12 A n=1 Tax=Neolecta irregularis (strain DAH-3) TaxID=1198029 RepID=A0A1U7LR75_NEOID|nr:Protein LSM12 A [Neolecta irregularis DAH-3]|eukprot:OLL25083.1 Protein LSM12 A [Neolecta irregularis DAH-3]